MRLMLLALASCLLAAESVRADGPALVLAPDAIQPQVAIDGAGNVHVVYLHGGNIVVRSSANRGKTFGPAVVAIDARGKARGGRQRGPRIGADGKGNLVVTAPLTFDPEEAARKYPVTDLYLTTSTDRGKTWSEPLRVNEVPRKAPEALHWLAVGQDGTAHVAWLDMRDRNRGQDLYYSRVAAGKAGKNVPIAREVCECCAPGLAVDGDGHPLAAFREGGMKDSREIFALRSTDQGGSFGALVQLNRQRSNELSCPMSAPAVAVSADGKKFAAAWMDKRAGTQNPNVYWAISDRPTFGDDSMVHDTPRGVQDHPALALDSAGKVWVAWEDTRAGQQRIRVRTTAKGEGDREVSTAAEGVASFPCVAANSGLVALVYEARQSGKAPTVVFRLLAP